MKSLLAKFHHKDLIILCVIVLFGTYLRLLPIIDLSFPYTYDVGRDLLAVSEIVHHFSIPLIGPTTGLPGLFYGPWWYYILVPSFIVGGGNPQIVVLFMAFTGLVAVVLGFILGKKLQGSFLGLLMALLLAISPAIISLTTQIWNPNLAPLLLMFLLFVLALLPDRIKAHKKNNYDRRTIALLVLVGVLCGLSIDSEVIYGLLLTGSLFVYLALFVFRKQLLAYAYVLLGLLIIFSPRIFFELRHNFVMTRTIFINLHNGNSLPEHAGIITQFISALNSLKGVWDYTFGIQNAVLGWVLLVFTFLIIIRYLSSFSSSAKQIIIYIVITLLTYLIGLTFFSGAIWGHYTVGLPVLFIVIFCMAIAVIPLKGAVKYVGAVCLVLFLVLSVNPSKLIDNYLHPLAVTDVAVYKNQVEVVEYVYAEANGQRFSKLVYTPPVRDYTYQYLFEWIGKRKTGFEADQSKAKLLFVIIEPDPGYEDRLKNWLLEKKDLGKIVKQKTFPSGIMVQTRLL